MYLKKDQKTKDLLFIMYHLKLSERSRYSMFLEEDKIVRNCKESPDNQLRNRGFSTS